MSKITFTFASEASPSNPKTTIIQVKLMQLSPDGPVFAFPKELQGIDLHAELMDTSGGKLVKNALKVRGKSRTVHITLNSEIYKKYADSDGNPVFKDVLLEEWHPPRSPIYSSVLTPPAGSSLTDEPQEIEPVKLKPLSTIVKDMVLQKFGIRRTNASSWLDIFESECKRLEIPPTRFWEAVRLFLEGSALDWYDSRRLTLEDADWDVWRKSFLDAFAQKGWSEARFALTFRYMSGSLSEYAIKKENLLINLHRHIDEEMKIFLIVAGLPLAVQEKLDRSEIPSVSELLRKLNALDRPDRSALSFDKSNATSTSNSSSNYSSFAFSSIRPRTPCPYCLKKGFERLHAESNCRTKVNDLARSPRLNVNKNTSTFNVTPSHPKPEKQAVNNLELEQFLNDVEEESKNA